MVDLADYTACKRCGRLFRRMHGNRRYCSPGCRRPRLLPGVLWRSSPAGASCAAANTCRRLASEVLFCIMRDAGCGFATRSAGSSTATCSGGVRCGGLGLRLGRCAARGAACRFSEGGLGGLICPDQQWDLGHADGESVDGAEQRICNRGAPQRLRARPGSGL